MAGRKPILDSAAWDRLVEFYHDGHTQQECAIRFGVSKRTVQRYFQMHPEIPRRKPLEAARAERAMRSNNPNVLQRVLDREAAQKLGDTTQDLGRPPIRKRKIIELEDYEL